MLIDANSGLMVDFLRLIDVNAGGFRLKKGQGILHRIFSNYFRYEFGQMVNVQQLKKGVFGKGLFRNLCAELCFVFFCVLSGFSPANLTEISFRNCPSNGGIFWKTPLRKTPKRSC